MKVTASAVGPLATQSRFQPPRSARVIFRPTGVLRETLANANILNNRPGCLTALGLNSPIADGTAYSNIFVNSQVPTACMDQTALDLMNQFVPQANIGDNTFQGVPLGHETQRPIYREDRS